MGSRFVKSLVILALVSFVFCSKGDDPGTGARTRRKLDGNSNRTETESVVVNTLEPVNRRIYHQTPIRNPFGAKIYSSRKSSTIRHRTESDYAVNTTESTANLGVETLHTELNRIRFKEEEEEEDGGRDKDMTSSNSGASKSNKETVKDEDEEEKTLAQQVADGKYGLIQNEIFANGSKRPGILSYSSNSEVPKDTRENLGGLEKDEIWLAEDHILVLRGGKFGDGKENDTTTVWTPIDDYVAPNRQVKIPKNPKIPPPFPVQLTENGPLQFIKGQLEPNINPQFLIPFPFPTNKSGPFTYGLPPPPLPPPPFGNQSLLFPLPPVPIPPFLANFPPGATFLSPPSNMTDIDEDDPSIYYPPKYDFYYPQANNSPVPAGPLVPGIILPPPPDFFAPLENETRTGGDKNEADISINIIAQNPFAGPKYLPLDNKQSTKLNVVNNRNFKRPTINDVRNQLPKTPTESKKPGVTYVYPENVKTDTPTDLLFNTQKPKNTNLKVPIDSPKERPIYYPLPTTSPKPNHITVPSTLSKDIYIVTTPEAEHNKIDDIYKNSKHRKPVKYENINPELHPLRSLIRPNVSVSYTGKYGHLPASTQKPFPVSDAKKLKPIGHYITQSPPEITQNTITSTPDVNVTPVPIVKKIRIRPIVPDNANPSTVSPSKATFYFYEEPAKTEAPKEMIQLIETNKEATPDKPESNNEITPVTQFYSTSKTPIRQFLEETYHASNPYKDQRVNSSPKPLKYHYVTEVPPIIIPSPNIKALEIQNSGSTGLQKVNLEQVRPTPQPYFTPETFTSPKPDPPKHFTPVKPTPNINDSPFIPSNYYATSRPDHVHFTAQEQTLVDDITKNYFTIFGQKIPSQSTTPLTPVKPKRPKGKNVEIIQEEHAKHNNTKPNNVQHQSHFEQYLKEITGEDQRDYIVTGVQGKIKKGKGFIPFAGIFPTPLYPSKPVPIQPFRVEPPPVQPYPDIVNVRKLVYSTTLRPVLDVEINPQYIQQISPGPRPFPIVQPTVPHPKIPLTHNLGQYLQEITGFANPTTVNPVKIKSRPTRLLVSPSGTPHKESDLRNPSNPTIGITDRPISLESDIIVNFKHPLPPVNRDAEHIELKRVKENTFVGGSNIKIVDSPDLTKEQKYIVQSGPIRPHNTFESARQFFQNLPSSGYFNPSHQTASNSFVSYNLPGNGGHFYFLTPQILDNPEQRIQNRGSKFHPAPIPQIRTHANPNPQKNNFRRNYSTEIGHNGYSNHDYLRRRRKKS